MNVSSTIRVSRTDILVTHGTGENPLTIEAALVTEPADITLEET